MHILQIFRRRARRFRRGMSNSLKHRIIFLTGVLFLLMFLHVLAMVLLESISWGDAAWLTITTATTVGYGDISASTGSGRWATGLLMYAGGIFVLAQLAGLIFEAAQAATDRRLRGKVHLRGKGQIVIFGWRPDYVLAVVKEIRASMLDLSDADIFIVSPHLEELPEELRSLDVHHVNGPFHDALTMEKASVKTAARFVVLPDSDHSHSDFVSADLTDRLHQQYPGIPIIVCCLQRKLEAAASASGAQDTMTFDVNYPDMLARAILALGAENVVDELISESGAEMIIVQQPLICSVGEVIDCIDGQAIFVGFRRLDASYAIHPPRETMLEDDQLIFLVDVDFYDGAERAEAALSDLLIPLTEDRPILRFAEPKRVGLIGAGKRVTGSYFRRLESELRGISVEHLCEDCWVANFNSKDKENLRDLDAIILLADDARAPSSDAKTFLAIRYLREELDFIGRIIAEAVLPENRERFEARGANDVLRPVSRNLDIIARCVLTGAEEVLDSLYSSYGPQELVTIAIDTEKNWGQILKDTYDLGLHWPLKTKADYALCPNGSSSRAKEHCLFCWRSVTSWRICWNG